MVFFAFTGFPDVHAGDLTKFSSDTKPLETAVIWTNSITELLVYPWKLPDIYYLARQKFRQARGFSPLPRYPRVLKESR
jgi:hypothetical protein